MITRRLCTLTALALAVVGLGPATAAADTAAACGTTADQWVGTFTGIDHFTGAPPDADPDSDLKIRISGGLAVRTVLNGKEQTAKGPGTIVNGNFSWTTKTYLSPYELDKRYDSTNVTCSGGRVTALRGVADVTPVWIGPFAAADDPSFTFTLTRAS